LGVCPEEKSDHSHTLGPGILKEKTLSGIQQPYDVGKLDSRNSFLWFRGPIAVCLKLGGLLYQKIPQALTHSSIYLAILAVKFS
jgi:hypothetical protein